MRALPAPLLAAQRSGSGRPYLRVQLFDQDVGTMRLRWTRWYSGSEPDGPCGAAVPADGALLRARIVPADGTLAYQRVASPSASANYSVWSSLGTVAVGPALGLAAAGTRALIATVRTDGVSVEVRESSTSGTAFGASVLVATAAATVSAVTCALQADGSAAVFYAAGGTVFQVTRSGLGAWSAPVAWTSFLPEGLASVSGLAAYGEGDYDVLVSGARASGEAGVWSTVYGAGHFVGPGSWLPLSEVAAAAAGTNVTTGRRARSPPTGHARRWSRATQGAARTTVCTSRAV